MIIALWGLVLVLGGHFAIRRFDVFTIAFLSSCLYFSPALFPSYPIEDGAYFIYMFTLVAVWIASVLASRHGRIAGSVEQNRQQLSVYFVAAAFLCFPLALLDVALHGLVAGGKTDAQSGGLLHYSFAVMLGFLTICALHLRKKLAIALCAIAYVLFVLRGDRTQIVITAIATALFAASYTPLSLRDTFRRLKPYQIALVALVVFAGFFGKSVYGAYFDSQAGQEFSTSFLSRMSGMIETPSAGLEPYHVQSILDFAIKGDDRIDSGYLLWIPVQALPFAGDLGANVHAQSNVIKQLYFSNWSDQAGVSSNFFAEGYLLWGYFGAIVAAVVYAFGLFVLSRLIAARRLTVRLAAVFGAAFWAFYIHRSSLSQIVSHEKRIAYAMAILVVVAAAVRAIGKVAPRRSI